MLSSGQRWARQRRLRLGSLGIGISALKEELRQPTCSCDRHKLRSTIDFLYQIKKSMTDSNRFDSLPKNIREGYKI